MSFEQELGKFLTPNKHQKKITIFYFAFGFLLYLCAWFFPGEIWGDIIEVLKPYFGGMRIAQEVNQSLGLNPHPAQIMIPYVFLFWIIFVLCWAFVLIGNAPLQMVYVDSFLSQRKNKSTFRNIVFAISGCLFSLSVPWSLCLMEGSVGRYTRSIYSSLFFSVGFFQLFAEWFFSFSFVFYLVSFRILFCQLFCKRAVK